ncbi:hypothetical protein P7C70_g3964, partial [Phenoliferia sp. Uapishka_3]
MFPITFNTHPSRSHTPLPFHSPFVSTECLSPSPSAFDFEAYDAHRTALEQRALALKQQERRVAEEKALHCYYQQLEAERRQEQQEALYEALLSRRAEEEAYARAVEQQQVRAAAIQQAKAAALQRAYAEEVQRRRQAIMEAQAHEQHRRQAAQELEQRRQVEETLTQKSQQESLAIHPFQAFLQHLFDQQCEEASSTESTPPPPVAPLPVPSQACIPAVPIDYTPATAQPIEVSTSATVDVSVTTPDETSASDAAETLQRHFRAHLARREALSQLSTLSSTLSSQKSSFVAPTSLVFQPSPPSTASSSTSSESPKLAYSPVNAPFLAYEDFLVGLLTKVDAVQSGGDKLVKRARKELVREIEAELRKLDERKEGEWEMISKAGETEVELENENANSEGVTPTSSASTILSTSTSTETPIDPTPDATSSLPSDVVENLSKPSLNDSAGIDDSTHIDVTEPTSITGTLSSESSSSPDAGLSPTPLTTAALASLPVSSRPPRTANSDSDSTTDTASTLEGFDMLDEVMRVASKLGEEVFKMERAEVTA